MHNFLKLACLLLVTFLFLNIILTIPGNACKDIIACGDATEGDYNLLLKVRDPSRPGLQVLTIIPEDYEYTYHHPWTGKNDIFTTEHKYIGVATKDDVIPNIVKAGMALSNAGIAYGDADTNSRWKNPTKHAWDDFDWIRYACQKADDEDEAVTLLTEDAVDKLHASGVSENLFVVGPNKGYVVEADVFHYDVKEVSNGIVVMHNYPKELWKTQRLKKFPISRSFDTFVEKYVQKLGAVRLQSIYGIRIVEIGNDFISVRPVPLIYTAFTKNIGVITKIQIGERKSIGDFSITLLDIENNKANVRVTNVFKAWEEKMLEHIQPRYGDITVEDMMNWSRLHNEDLDDLRPMCQDDATYEAVAIYKIPNEDYEILSEGWFSANHACSSIYVPFHICDTEIYDPYENGDAAQLSLDLLDTYRHDFLSDTFIKTEEVFLNEINNYRDLSNGLKNDELSTLFTTADTGMQRQAFLTQELWFEASKATKKDELIEILSTIWDSDYSSSLEKMKTAISNITNIQGSSIFRDKIIDIALDICKTRIDITEKLGEDTSLIQKEYEKGEQFFMQGKDGQGFESIQRAFTDCELLLSGESPKLVEKEKPGEDYSINLLILIIIVALVVIILAIVIRKK
jgi:hypothetical protein